MEHTIAIGDSLTDVNAFQSVGRSIAINYDSNLDNKASFYLNTDSLLNILEFFIKLTPVQ